MDQGLMRRPHLNKVFDNVIEVIEAINERLEEIQEELRAIQPYESGSIILYLNRHSKKQATCFSCPHPDWRQAVWVGPKGAAKVNMRAIRNNPIKRVARKGSFMPIYGEICALIREAQELHAEKKGYAEILGNLSRMISHRMDVPEFGERLTASERGKILKELILQRLDDLDAGLKNWAEILEELQPEIYNRKVVLALEKCGHDCDYCPHPHWYVYVKSKGRGKGLAKKRVDSPLPAMPRNAEDSEIIEAIRNCVKKARPLFEERKKYAYYVGRLSKLYQTKRTLA
jgi:hypothetical protein